MAFGAGIHTPQALDTAASPTFAAVKINGTQVVGAQATAVADVSGGAIVDVECRAAMNALLPKLRTHGTIAT